MHGYLTAPRRPAFRAFFFFACLFLALLPGLARAATECSDLDISVTGNDPLTDSYDVTGLQYGARFDVVVTVGGDGGTLTVGLSTGGSSVYSTSLVLENGDVFDTGSFDWAAGTDTIALDLSTAIATTPPALFAALSYTVQITCTPLEPDEDQAQDVEEAVVQQDKAVVAFMVERQNRLIEDEPDRPRMVRKRLDSLWGDSASSASSAPARAGDADMPPTVSEDGRYSQASLSLRGMTQVFGADIVITDDGDVIPPEPEATLGCWDLWGEGRYQRFFGDGDRSGSYTSAYVGIDCQAHPSAIVGFLGMFDWLDDELGTIDTRIEGSGWMIGPYATVRLTRDLFFDLRGAWGRTQNTLDDAGVTGEFDTERWLVSGRLTGNFLFDEDRYRISPEVRLTYSADRHDTYFDSAGAFHGEQEASLARLKFGPEFAVRLFGRDGNIYEPHFSIKGLWDFDVDDVTIAGTTLASEGMRGVAEIGLIVRTPKDWNFRISAKYDGIGIDDYRSYGVTAWLNIPLP